MMLHECQRITVIAAYLSGFLLFNLQPPSALGNPAPAPVEFAWKDQYGHVLPDAADRKSKNNFAAQILLTEDKDLWQRWNSLPTEVAPRITTVDVAKRNVAVFIPVVFANPQLDSNGNSDISCDLSITKPDGKITRFPRGLMIWKGKYPISPSNLCLGKAMIEYVVENSDPSGIYQVNAIVKDNNRKVELPLHKSFTIK